MDNDPRLANGQDTWLTGLRSVLGGLDLTMGVLLGAMLLPLVVGPFVVVYQFVQARAYVDALLVGGLFTGVIAVGVRAVRRGEFGPATLAAVLALLGLMLFMATRLPR